MVIVFLLKKANFEVEDWVWAVWDNSEPDREDSAAEVFLEYFEIAPNFLRLGG